MQSKRHQLAGQLIRKRRLELGLSMREVVDGLQGVTSIQFLSNIEHGRVPIPIARIRELVVALKLEPEVIVQAMIDDHWEWIWTGSGIEKKE